MTLRTTIAIALAVLVVGAGVSGAVAAMDQTKTHANETTADDRRPDHAGESHDENETESAGTEAHARGDASANASTEVGPSLDLPSPTPDHVVEIHQRISAYVDGTLNATLGTAVSAVASDGNASGEARERDGGAANVSVDLGGSVGVDASDRTDGRDAGDGVAVDARTRGSADDSGGTISAHVSAAQDVVSGFVSGTVDSFRVAVGLQ